MALSKLVTGVVATLLLFCSCVAASEQLILQHRLDTGVASSATEWTTRGRVNVLNHTWATFEQEQRASDLLQAVGGEVGAQAGYYVRIVKPGQEQSQSQSQTVRTKACLVEALAPGSYSFDVLSLTFPPESLSHLPLVSYDIVALPPLSASTGCPRRPLPRKGGSAATRDTQLKVSVEPQMVVEDAQLRVAPRPRADGAVGAEVPPPEKGFLQKYWYYILPILVLLALPSEPPAPAQDGNAATGAQRIR
ncbi:unnamed protein product [Jaminaea pallidilutea]